MYLGKSYLLGIFVFLLIIFFAPEGLGRLLALVANIAVLAYLRQQMQMDMTMFQTTNKVEKAGELGGCLIGLGVLILFLLFSIVVAFILVFLGVPTPN